MTTLTEQEIAITESQEVTVGKMIDANLFIEKLISCATTVEEASRNFAGGASVVSVTKMLKLIESGSLDAPAAAEVILPCQACKGRGSIYTGNSGLESDGDAPEYEKCDECGGSGKSDYPITMREHFESWADEKGFCLDCIFMSTDGVPENPYEDDDTKLAYEVWMSAWNTRAAGGGG